MFSWGHDPRVYMVAHMRSGAQEKTCPKRNYIGVWQFDSRYNLPRVVQLSAAKQRRATSYRDPAANMFATLLVFGMWLRLKLGGSCCSVSITGVPGLSTTRGLELAIASIKRAWSNHIPWTSTSPKTSFSRAFAFQRPQTSGFWNPKTTV